MENLDKMAARVFKIMVKCPKPEDPARIARRVYEMMRAQFAGTVCQKCRQDYPYAEARVNFVCWECINT